MAGIRKKHSKETKLKVVLAVLAGDRPVAQIAQEYGVHPAQIKEWKAQAVEAMGERFAQRRGRKSAAEKPEAMLYEQIGRLKVDLDFLSGKLGRCSDRSVLG
jgi:transposase-like protein